MTNTTTTTRFDRTHLAIAFAQQTQGLLLAPSHRDTNN